MSILQYRPSELMSARYKASQAIQRNNDLIVGNKTANNPRVKLDQLKDTLALARLVDGDDFSHCKDIN